MKAVKTIIIGLDGMDWKYLKEYKSSFPNLWNLIKSGCSAKLDSVQPPVSLPAWRSFLTGKNPGKHGIFDFTEKREDSYKIQLTDVNKTTDFFFKQFSDNNLKTIVINVPSTYPPIKIPNTTIVSGMLTPTLESGFTYPVDIGEEIKEQYNYRIDPLNANETNNQIEFIKDIKKVLEIRLKTFDFLIKNKEWNLFIGVVTATDRLFHHFIHYIDESHSEHIKSTDKKDKLIKEEIRAIFELIDNFIGRLNSNEHNLFIISDHGFGPLHKTVYINQYFKEKGYLILKSDRNVIKKISNLFGFDIKKTLELIKKLHLNFLFKIVPKDLQKSIAKSFYDSLDDIDWSKTKVYSFGNFGRIFYNLKGRDKEGVIEDEDKFFEKIKKDLFELRDGKIQVITNVKKAKDVYQGPFINQAPDIIFDFHDGKYVTSPNYTFGSKKVIDKKLDEMKGCHRQKGIFIASGPDIKKDLRLEERSIMDVVPTVLSLFGLPISEDLDGVVIKHIIK